MGAAVAALVLAAVLPAASSGTPDRSLFDYDRSLPLDVSWGKTTTSNGVVRQGLTFATARRARVAALFVHPARGGPWPLVLWTPGRGGDRTEELPDATALARNGVASLLVDPPAPEVVTCNPAKDFAIFVRYVIGRRRAVDLALTLPNVDGQRLAAAGFSFGASVTADLAGVEHRIRAFALKSGRAHHTGFMRLACAQLGRHKLHDYLEKLAAVDPINWISRSGLRFVLSRPGRDARPVEPEARCPRALRGGPRDKGTSLLPGRPRAERHRLRKSPDLAGPAASAPGDAGLVREGARSSVVFRGEAGLPPARLGIEAD